MQKCRRKRSFHWMLRVQKQSGLKNYETFNNDVNGAQMLFEKEAYEKKQDAQS